MRCRGIARFLELLDLDESLWPPMSHPYEDTGERRPKKPIPSSPTERWGIIRADALESLWRVRRAEWTAKERETLIRLANDDHKVPRELAEIVDRKLNIIFYGEV